MAGLNIFASAAFICTRFDISVRLGIAQHISISLDRRSTIYSLFFSEIDYTAMQAQDII